MGNGNAMFSAMRARMEKTTVREAAWREKGLEGEGMKEYGNLRYLGTQCLLRPMVSGALIDVLSLAGFR